MDLQKIHNDSDFQNAVVPEGQVLVFNGTENGKPVTRYKDSSGNFGTISGTGGTDTGDATATAADIAEGKTAYIASGKVTGTLVPSSGGMDFYRCTEVCGPQEITYYTVSGAGTTDCNGKYEDSGETQNNLPVYSYASSSGTTWYLYYFYDEYEGAYWIISTSKTSYPYEAPYYSSSITSGWHIGSGEEPVPTVTATTETINADQLQTWNGQKAVLTDDGIYVFEETVTTGLTYGTAYTPYVGDIYNADATVRSSVWQGGLVSLDFNDGTVRDKRGHQAAVEGGGIITSGIDGNAWYFSGGYITVSPATDAEFCFGAGDFTFEMDIYPTASSRQCIVAYQKDSVFAVSFSYDGSSRRLAVWYSGAWSHHTISDALELNTWYHIAVQRKNRLVRCFVNGTATLYAIAVSANIGQSGQYIGFGRWGNDASDFSARWQGYMDNIKIHKEALY